MPPSSPLLTFKPAARFLVYLPFQSTPLCTLGPRNIELGFGHKVERHDATGDIRDKKETQDSDGGLRDAPWLGCLSVSRTADGVRNRENVGEGK